MAKIARRCGVSADWLLGLTDERTPRPAGAEGDVVTATAPGAVAQNRTRNADCARCPQVLRLMALLETALSERGRANG